MSEIDQLPVTQVLKELFEDSKISDITLATEEPVAFAKNNEMHDTEYLLSKQEYLKLCELLKISEGDGNVKVFGRRARYNRCPHEFGDEIVLRPFPLSIPTPQDLSVPNEFLEKFMEVKQGIVFVCGATGQGKSTTIASCIQHRANQFSERILTIEDPIEIEYPRNTKSQIRQREVGNHVADFNVGLIKMLRQKPNTIVVGEIRDGETAEIALRSAETGHLVICTLHTNSVVETFDRLYSEMHVTLQKKAANLLSKYMVMVMCQRLYPSSITNGRVAIHQVLFNTTGVGNNIASNDAKAMVNLRNSFTSGTEHTTYLKSLAKMSKLRKISAADFKAIKQDLENNSMD